MKGQRTKVLTWIATFLLLASGANWDVASAKGQTQQNSHPQPAWPGSGASKLKEFGASRVDVLFADPCSGFDAGCRVRLLMLDAIEVDSRGCETPELVFGDNYLKRGTTGKTYRDETKLSVVIQEATLVFRPTTRDSDNSSPTTATRHNSLANVLVAAEVSSRGQEICWPDTIPFADGQIEFLWGEWLLDEEYQKRYGSPFAAIKGTGDNNPFRCLWLGCTERSILKLEVVSEPPGQKVYLDGAERITTNSAFSISRESLAKLMVGSSVSSAKPLVKCATRRVARQKLRFSC